MSKFFDGLEKYIYWTSIPKIGLNDIVDILIVSVMIYLIVKWINNKSLGIIKRDHYLALYCICGIFTAITYSFMDSFQYNECGNHSDFDRLPARTPKRIGTAWKKELGD